MPEVLIVRSMKPETARAQTFSFRVLAGGRVEAAVETSGLGMSK